MTNLERFDFLMEYGIATMEEIGLVTAINGNNRHTYESILYVRTGYDSFENFIESELEEDEEEDEEEDYEDEEE